MTGMKVIIDTAISKLHPRHEAQAINYLAATGFRLAILLNPSTELRPPLRCRFPRTPTAGEVALCHEFYKLTRKIRRLVRIRVIRGKGKLSENSCNSWQRETQ